MARVPDWRGQALCYFYPPIHLFLGSMWALLQFPHVVRCPSPSGRHRRADDSTVTKLVTSELPEDQRGLANGIWGMTAVVGPVAGPILGGWITDNISWSWIFYINLPFGIIAAALTFILRRRETPKASSSLDVVGLALLLVGVAALQVMLDKGNDEEWFQSPFIIINFIIAILGFSFFMAWELTEKTSYC